MSSTDMKGYTFAEFLDKIGDGFEITETGNTAFRPARKGEFGLYGGGSWYRLAAKPKLLSDDPVAGLDVSILQDHILGPVLGSTIRRQTPGSASSAGSAGSTRSAKPPTPQTGSPSSCIPHRWMNFCASQMRESSCRRNRPGSSQNSGAGSLSTGFELISAGFEPISAGPEMIICK